MTVDMTTNTANNTTTEESANADYWNPMVPELTVTDFNASLKFYCDILGFSIRFQRSEPDFVYLELEKVQLMLEPIHEDMWQTADLEKPFGRGVNFQIELTDIAPVLERLQSANVPLFREQKDNWYDTGETLSGQREFLVQDPDGYLLRFSQYLGEKAL